MRIEQDPDETKQEENAIRRAATPMHEQVTEDFDSRELILRLGQTTNLDVPGDIELGEGN